MAKVEVDPRFYPIQTVRIPNSDGQFRPAGTDTDMVIARRKAEAELAEITVLTRLGVFAVSSALSDSQNLARQAAIEEANERASLAAWWRYGRQALGRVALKYLEVEGITWLPELQIAVLPSTRYGFTTVCIATDKSEYPYAVLGSAFDTDLQISAKKSVFEALQSWNGTIWYRSNNPRGAPRWDLEELLARSEAIAQLPEFVSDPLHDRMVELGAPAGCETHCIDTPLGYLAWVSHADANHTPQFLASLVAHDQDQSRIYTRPNW